MKGVEHFGKDLRGVRCFSYLLISVCADFASLSLFSAQDYMHLQGYDYCRIDGGTDGESRDSQVL